MNCGLGVHLEGRCYVGQVCEGGRSTSLGLPPSLQQAGVRFKPEHLLHIKVKDLRGRGIGDNVLGFTRGMLALMACVDLEQQ